MSLIRSIKTFIKDPAPTAKLEEVVPGLNLVDGIIRIRDPLRSPVRGQNCAAFFYRAFLVITGGRAPAFHKLKELEVYAPFDLDMEGGTLKVIPAKTVTFEQEDHLALSRKYPKGFQGVEEVILPGAKVRLRGKAFGDSEGTLTLKLNDISVIEKQVVSSGVVGDRKKRKKKKN